MVRHVKIVDRMRGWCAIEIPRCGCTGLKEHAWRDAYGEYYDKEKDGVDIHRRLGYAAAESNGLVVEWDHGTTGLFHFAVWRPPIERCVSTWRGFTKELTLHGYFKALMGCSWDEWVDFIVARFKEDGSRIDPHIRRQVDFFHESDVDAIIPIRFLDDWLLKKFGNEPLPREKINRSQKSDASYFSPFAGEKIVELYARDSLIPLSNKFLKQ